MSVELVSKLKLKAETPTEQRILDYLNENASDVLAEKINVGTKTLAGAVRYATAEAKKQADGEGCVCVDDATVFGWIIHFFEEDDIAEQPKKEKAAVKLPVGVKEKSGGKKAEKKAKHAKPADPAKPAEPAKPKGPIILELFSCEEMRGKAK